MSLMAQAFQGSLPSLKGQACSPFPVRTRYFLEMWGPRGLGLGSFSRSLRGRCGLGREPALLGLGLFFFLAGFISSLSKRTNSTLRGRHVLREPCVCPLRLGCGHMSIQLFGHLWSPHLERLPTAVPGQWPEAAKP